MLRSGRCGMSLGERPVRTGVRMEPPGHAFILLLISFLQTRHAVSCMGKLCPSPFLYRADREGH